MSAERNDTKNGLNNEKRDPKRVRKLFKPLSRRLKILTGKSFSLPQINNNGIFYASWGPIFLGTPQNPDKSKTPSPEPTNKKLKEARKGNRSPCKGTQWPRIRVAKTVLLANDGFVCGTPAIFIIFVGFRALRTATPCFCR